MSLTSHFFFNPFHLVIFFGHFPLEIQYPPNNKDGYDVHPPLCIHHIPYQAPSSSLPLNSWHIIVNQTTLLHNVCKILHVPLSIYIPDDTPSIS